MRNELEICTLKFTFGVGGYSCSFTIRRGEIVIATAPTLPANKKFCLTALNYLAKVEQIPKAELIGLRIQLEQAFRERAEASRPRLDMPDLFTDVLIDVALADIAAVEEECTARLRN